MINALNFVMIVCGVAYHLCNDHVWCCVPWETAHGCFSVFIQNNHRLFPRRKKITSKNFKKSKSWKRQCPPGSLVNLIPFLDLSFLEIGHIPVIIITLSFHSKQSFLVTKVFQHSYSQTIYITAFDIADCLSTGTFVHVCMYVLTNDIKFDASQSKQRPDSLLEGLPPSSDATDWVDEHQQPTWSSLVLWYI